MKLFVILVAQTLAQNDMMDQEVETGNLQYNPTVFPTVTAEPPVETGKNLVKVTGIGTATISYTGTGTYR